MTTYKEPFKISFIKNLRQFFSEVLNKTQPIIISFKAGNGWDWLGNKGDTVNISIDESEIVQCNIVQDSFVIYTDFGYGYCYFPIPLNCIDCIFIGEEISENFISSPIIVPEYDLPEAVLKVALNEQEIKEEENND